jgi:hypothetical protein
MLCMTEEEKNFFFYRARKNITKNTYLTMSNGELWYVNYTFYFTINEHKSYKDMCNYSHPIEKYFM